MRVDERTLLARTAALWILAIQDTGTKKSGGRRVYIRPDAVPPGLEIRGGAASVGGKRELSRGSQAPASDNKTKAAPLVISTIIIIIIIIRSSSSSSSCCCCFTILYDTII